MSGNNRFNSMASKDTVDRQISFATSSPGDDFGLTYMKKPKPDSGVSTRILEKRRRDRMNNCLADLSALIPSSYLKEGKGRIEKIEIIGMAINHIKDLTSIIAHKQDGLTSSLPDRYLGFKECQDEVMRYLVEVENWDAQDQLCNRMMKHLEQAGEKFRIMNDASLSQAKKEEEYWTVDMDSCSLRSKMAVLEDEGLDTSVQLSNLQKSPKGSSPQSQKSSRQQYWALPTVKCNISGVVEDSGLSTDPGSSTSNRTDTSIKYLNYENVLNGSFMKTVPPLGISSSPTSTETGSENEKNVYKFKHRITKRFTDEATQRKNNLNDSSSISSKGSHQMAKETIRRKIREVRSRSLHSAGSSHLPKSNSSNNNSCSNGASISSGDEELKSSCYLPGFVLHPAGSHYIPLSINASNIDNEIFTRAAEQEVGYHPIRILVNFGGPLVYMQNSAIDRNNVGSAGQSLSLGCSGSDSPLSCSSDNSRNQESKVVTNSQ